MNEKALCGVLIAISSYVGAAQSTFTVDVDSFSVNKKFRQNPVDLLEFQTTTPD